MQPSVRSAARGAPSGRRGWLAGAAREVGRHPSLWPTGVRQALALARPGWWRAWPPVPAPPDEYLRFRLQTAYGGDGSEPLPGDVVTYLGWCRQWRQVVRRERHR